ncbi:MAG: 4-oxalocrotonate tautomerase [Parafilimonas terrae]|nr:4-oxalocrotonate tautomerase [Parafilimonas terrae]
MPTYCVTSPAGCIPDAARNRIARDITRIHHEQTGAPSFFAQTFFHDIPAGSYFLGGEKLESDQIFVCGHIRAGRSTETKNRMMIQMVDAMASATGLPPNRIWVYIVDVPAAQMAEFGRILPEPGAEADWVARLDPRDRERMQAEAA